LLEAALLKNDILCTVTFEGLEFTHTYTQSLKLSQYNLMGTPRRRWVDNIKVYVREIGREGVEWIHLAQDRD